MYKAKEIRVLEIELTSNCQASCPLCLRNFHGADYNKGYKVKSLTTDEIRTILKPDFISQLDTIIFEGNLGDAIVVSDLADTVEYLRDCNSHMEIEIHTNASAGSQYTWTRLANAKCRVFFALDGLSDTHHLYRRGTDWQKIINNAQTFISAGGEAIWKFIPLSTNSHQEDQCRKLSRELGFHHFAVMGDTRQNCHVYSKTGDYEYTIGNPRGEPGYTKALQDYKLAGEEQHLRDIPDSIECYADKRKYLYLDALGDVYPCCYLGAQPRTFDRSGGVMKSTHERVDELMHNNNLFDNTLSDAVEWFNQIPACWSESMDKRLAPCDNVCGRKVNYVNIE
jgi:MoaA/NifB/PqqE/SkfB family radical SAM enzyme